MRNIYFTPGPSGLYYTVEHHMKEALKTGVASISHRSKQFEAIYKEAVESISALLSLPANYNLVFTSSATEIWERCTDSLIADRSLHIVNGAFSNKFYQTALDLGKTADIIAAEWGDFPTIPDKLTQSYDLIGITHNETSTGVKTPLETIYKLYANNPESVIAVDAVSSLPVVALDYSKVDTVYASVQKAFGLPAGLGMWIINEKTAEKAKSVAAAGKQRNSNHNLLALLNQGVKYQTPSTPNILGIYLLAKISKDMLDRGIQQIRNDGVYKAAILYNMLDQHDSLKPFVKTQNLRSETIIVIDSGDKTDKLISYLSERKLIVGSGYGKMKGKQVRIANFPTHSKEQFEMLVDLIEKFE